MAFQTEKAHYRQLLPELLKAHKGEYAVFKDADFLGVFPTNSEAYTAAQDRYGLYRFSFNRFESSSRLADSRISFL